MLEGSELAVREEDIGEEEVSRTLRLMEKIDDPCCTNAVVDVSDAL